MDGYHLYPNPGKTSWSVVAGSMWLRLGVVAVTGAIIALAELYKGEIGILAAMGWIFGGAWIAKLSWHRGKALLDQPDDEPPQASPPEELPVITPTHPSWN